MLEKTNDSPGSETNKPKLSEGGDSFSKESWVDDFIEEWKGRLYLRAWSIQVIATRLEGDAVAFVVPSLDTFEAVIKYDPHLCEGLGHDLRRILLHEMIHISHERVFNMVANALESTMGGPYHLKHLTSAEEQLVELTTKTLADLNDQRLFAEDFAQECEKENIKLAKQLKAMRQKVIELESQPDTKDKCCSV